MPLPDRFMPFFPLFGRGTLEDQEREKPSQSKKIYSSKTGGCALDLWTKWNGFVQKYVSTSFLLPIILMIVTCKSNKLSIGNL